jgi:hypothetical protein
MNSSQLLVSVSSEKRISILGPLSKKLTSVRRSRRNIQQGPTFRNPIDYQQQSKNTDIYGLSRKYPTIPTFLLEATAVVSQRKSQPSENRYYTRGRKHYQAIRLLGAKGLRSLANLFARAYKTLNAVVRILYSTPQQRPILSHYRSRPNIRSLDSKFVAKAVKEL